MVSARGETHAGARDRVRAVTVLARPWLVPELELFLVTHDCELWRASLDDASAQGLAEPYWAFAWPGGQVLARWVLDHPELVRGKRVLDFGCGGGVAGLAAARAGAREVLCADVDPLAVAAADLNAEHAGLRVTTTADDLVGRADLPIDVVLAGDVAYEPELARRVRAWLERLVARGVEVLVGDPGRVPGALDGFDVLDERLAPFDGDVRGLTLWPTRVLRVRAPTALPAL